MRFYKNGELQDAAIAAALRKAAANYENGEVDGVRTIPSSDFARLRAEEAGVQVAGSYGTVYWEITMRSF